MATYKPSQDILVSGINIKTVNTNSLLGGGNVDISGGTSYGNFADIPPETPSAWDDEFSDSTIDVKWSWANQGTATAVEGEIATTLRMIPNDTVYCCALTQTVPAGSWIMTAKVHSGTGFDVTNYAGIGVMPSADGAFDTLMLGHATDASNTEITFRSESWNDWTTWNTDRGIKQAFGNMGYIRIVWNGSQLTYYVSSDGVAWVNFVSAFTPSYTPGRFGIFVRGTQIKSYFDWFRVTE